MSLPPDDATLTGSLCRRAAVPYARKVGCLCAFAHSILYRHRRTHTCVCVCARARVHVAATSLLSCPPLHRAWQHTQVTRGPSPAEARLLAAQPRAYLSPACRAMPLWPQGEGSGCGAATACGAGVCARGARDAPCAHAPGGGRRGGPRTGRGGSRRFLCRRTSGARVRPRAPAIPHCPSAVLRMFSRAGRASGVAPGRGSTGLDCARLGLVLSQTGTENSQFYSLATNSPRFQARATCPTRTRLQRGRESRYAAALRGGGARGGPSRRARQARRRAPGRAVWSG